MRDLLGLADRLSPGRPLSLLAHDWGAAVAYAAAIAARQRIAKLVVINGVHPAPFQGALLAEGARRATNCATPCAAQRFRKTAARSSVRALLGRFGALTWADGQQTGGLLPGLGGPPGAPSGMLNG